MDFGRIKELGNVFYSPEYSHKLSPEDLRNAKDFLSVVSSASSISLYDLMRQIIQTVLRHRMTDAVDYIENLCHILKSEKIPETEEFIAAPEANDDVLRRIDTLMKLFAEISEKEIVDVLRQAEDDEVVRTQDDVVNDSLEEGGVSFIQEELWILPYVPDVCHQMFRFNQVGVGLCLDETFEINMAIKALAKTFKLEKVRFWGKIFALHCNYYIAEAPYTEGVPVDTYGWIPPWLPKPIENIIDSEVKDNVPIQDPEMPKPETVPEIVLEKKEEPTDSQSTLPEENPPIEEVLKIPPLPEPKPPLPQFIKPEENGTGANKYMYFVCTMPGYPWRVLPQLRPDHVVDARILKKYFTGNLDAEVRGCVAFQGKEAHYLRTQIARISASTTVSPAGYFKLKEKPEGETPSEVAEPEVENIIETEEDPDFQPLPSKELFSEGTKAWVHHRPALLVQGRCLWTKSLEKLPIEESLLPNAEQTEKTKVEINIEIKVVENEEPQKEDIEAELKETPIPLLRQISKDRSAGGIIPWTIRRSSTMINESAVLVARSNVWPGAFSYFDGKTTDHIYIGYGHKYTARHYAPRLGEMWQKEYIIGSNIIEPIDEIIETPETSTMQDLETSDISGLSPSDTMDPNDKAVQTEDEELAKENVTS